jgi:hypothetical protein
MRKISLLTETPVDFKEGCFSLEFPVKVIYPL